MNLQVNVASLMRLPLRDSSLGLRPLIISQLNPRIGGNEMKQMNNTKNN